LLLLLVRVPEELLWVLARVLLLLQEQLLKHFVVGVLARVVAAALPVRKLPLSVLLRILLVLLHFQVLLLQVGLEVLGRQLVRLPHVLISTVTLESVCLFVGKAVDLVVVLIIHILQLLPV
jgi:hypothetical protein